jgi:hypothetical protein
MRQIRKKVKKVKYGRARPAYRWTIEHMIEVDDPMELVTTHIVEI